jgi:phospholipase/carboxylesterase
MQYKRVEDKRLMYVAAEPDGYQAGQKLPLIVLLHGYGAHMGDLAGFAQTIGEGYVYVFPNAPLPVHAGFGVGYAWTPIGTERTLDDVKQASVMLFEFIQQAMEEYSAAPGEVLLGGFSQGGMMTYFTGLPRPEIFKALVSLSGSVPEQDALRKMLPRKRDQRVFVTHGTRDEVLPIEHGRGAEQFLKKEKYKPDYHEYPMGHEIPQPVLDDLVPWIHTVFPPKLSQ